MLKRIFAQRKNLLHVATVNPEFVMEARKNKMFRKALEKTDLKVADGWGVVWGIRILQGVRVERVSGYDLVERILEKANEKREKVFLLGAMPGVARKAADEMRKVYSKLKIGWCEGARDVRRERREEMGLTLAKINAFEPDYLLVAYGSPWQDIWIEENRSYLRVRVARGVGGVLDEWAGVVRKCPRWLDRVGLKWLWRLILQPWRWKRVMRVFRFGMLVMWSKLRG